ncbi:phytanoyl-CoA dioxygenase family protein [Sedimentitalea sp. JM2-8]|uniref:Phytanoyl-CoA dioxygenase family protein n=1 Tax=Sedimentitalea xiamensis TaxID=3050037 RepID=A0ABT7FF76_9RHOB|nr:phytanoyl-CoA dioxygenase family protein [Sedimentitalea xiamensis]MDK3073789.1 phytanoyl-CoA dioxygenase family protein [Sedimentitalea xiamensis]
MSDARPAERFATRGWLRFDTDPALLDWVNHALPAARRAVSDPALSHWLDCGGTWFVGVDALANDAEGRVGASGPLRGGAVDFITRHIAPMPPLHRAQVSVTYPGYPQPRRGESEAAFRYRERRDSAHLDGVLASGPEKRRHVREPHAFILGIPLTDADPDAAPLVVWEGSHAIMRNALKAVLMDGMSRDPAEVDVTDAYVAARKQVFDTCVRVPLPVRTGQAVLLHRLLLHGVAPWTPDAKSGPDGRMIAYFRPKMPGGVRAWINDP